MQIGILSSDRFYVYEHLRADTGQAFYVGKGSGGRAHVTSKYHRSIYWQRTVAKAGGFTVRMVAESLPEELAFLAEIERIDQLRRIGMELCNLTDGGDGMAGLVRTQEWRDKIGRAHKGKIISQEVRDKIAATVRRIGYVHSEDARKKISEAHRGNTYTLGRKQPEQEKKKRAKSLLGNRNSVGRIHSEATKLAMSIAHAGRPQNRIQCPHCGKEGGHAMRRWHFDACKRVPQ